jgi:hypothetical protein
MRVLQIRLTQVVTVLFALIFGSVFANAQKDIQCGQTKVRYQEPGDCVRACRPEIDAERCMIQPNLKVLSSDGIFESLYNFSVLWGENRYLAMACGTNKGVDATLGSKGSMAVMPAGFPMLNVGSIRGVGNVSSRDKMLEHAFVDWYAPNQISELNVKWLKPEGSCIWADLDLEKKEGKYDLNLAVDVLCRSPAAMLDVIGHELIHKEQSERHYHSVGVDDFGAVRAALREDEAYSWELKTSNLPWKMSKISVNPFLAGMTQDEVSETQKEADCYEWKTEFLIDKLRAVGVPSLLTHFEKFLQEDPWTSKVWLPKHPDWMTHKAAPVTALCKAEFADDPSIAGKRPQSDRPWQTSTSSAIKADDPCSTTKK